MRLSFNLIALLLLACFALPVPAEQAKTIEYEAWYTLKLGGQKAGYMHASLEEEDGKLINKTSMVLTIKRGDVDMRIEQASRFIETLDYKPLRSSSSMKFALMATEQEIDFTGDQWVVTSRNAGQETRSKVAPPKIKWMTPGAMTDYVLQAIENGDKDITVTSLDPTMGTTPIKTQMTRGETENIEVFGKTIAATKWVTRTTAAPGVEIEQWSDENGIPVKQRIPMLPGMEVEMLLADKELALAEFDAPELLAASLIEPDMAIRNPRKLKRAVFDLVGEDLKENVGDAVPEAGFQQTEWVDGKTLRVTIDLDKPVIPERFIVAGEAMNASSMLNFKDEAIQKLIKQAVDPSAIKQADKNPAPELGIKARQQAAKSLRDFVRDHIEQKDLSVGFASASEVARTGRGDCTEHACLLAAMLRGAGIPSRTVTGLVYADQFAGRKDIFGFHMWTQAWGVDEQGNRRWIDLDAALPGDIDGFDATHIALSTSTMQDGEGFNDMVTLFPLMQGLEVKVIELEWAQ
ncbi:MAG: transglutaminase-like domain-containing protein [Planctomycetota bacterium]